jgi:hypothetical protein
MRSFLVARSVIVSNTLLAVAVRALLVLPLVLFGCSGGEPPSGEGDGDDSGGNSGGSGGVTNGGSGGAGTGGSALSGGTGGTGGSDPGSGGGTHVGPCPAQPVEAPFTLLWEDEFDSFDGGRWQMMSHTFHENLAQFSPQNVDVEGGYMKLRFTAEPTGDRDYRGAEVRTHQEFQYGRFDTCARFGRGGGVVGSFFTYRFGPWNEIDIEYLGGNPVGIQYNIIFDPGPQYDPEFDPLGYDPADDFHHYSFEWTPGVVRFYVDGQLRHTESGASAQAITELSTLRMNIWASWTGFAGDFEPNSAPTESWYDWVRVYDYNP